MVWTHVISSISELYIQTHYDLSHGKSFVTVSLKTVQYLFQIRGCSAHISGVKSARFGIENVKQPETITTTEAVRMSSVLPTVLLLAWPMHWEFSAWSAGLRALQYRGRQQTIGSHLRKTALRVHYTFQHISLTSSPRLRRETS